MLLANEGEGMLSGRPNADKCLMMDYGDDRGVSGGRIL